MKNLLITPAPYLAICPDFGPLGCDPTTLPVPLFDMTNGCCDMPCFANYEDGPLFWMLCVDYLDERSTRYQYGSIHGTDSQPRRYELLVSEYEGCDQFTVYLGDDFDAVAAAMGQLTQHPNPLPYLGTLQPLMTGFEQTSAQFFLASFCAYVPGMHPDDIAQIGTTGCIGPDGQLWHPFTEQEASAVDANMAQAFAVLGEDAAYDIMGYFLGNPDGSEDGGPAYLPSQHVEYLKGEYFPANA